MHGCCGLRVHIDEPASPHTSNLLFLSNAANRIPPNACPSRSPLAAETPCRLEAIYHIPTRASVA